MAGPNTPSVPNTPAPASEQGFADESAQWAALEHELETPDPILDAPNEDGTPRAKTEKVRVRPEETPDPEPPAPPEDDLVPDDGPSEDRPKVTYETLEQTQRRTAGALKAEREARRRAEENLQRILEEAQAHRAERDQLRPRTPEPEPPKIPSVEEDPIGHFQARMEMAEAALRQTYQGSQATAQQMEAERQEQVFWNHVQASEDAARAAMPKVDVDGRQVSDYDLACEHLKEHRMAELANLYPDTSAIAMAEARQYGLPSPAHLRAAILKQDAIGIAQRAFQLGVQPAKLYYDAAKGRGYVSKVGAAKPAGNGALAAHKRGQKASLTISGGEGRKSNNDMSISDLSELFVDDPEEFDKQWDRMARAGKLG